MTIDYNPLKQMLNKNVFLISILFVAINVHYDYILYHINTYKILALAISCTLLYLFYDIFSYSKSQLQKNTLNITISSWQLVLLLALPLLATIPGQLWHSSNNYNFHYELVTDIFLFLWAAYVFRNLQTPIQQQGFFIWLVLLIVFLTGYSILEFLGINPLSASIIPDRPKATFGNINYFAAFLATLTPLMLVLSLPKFEKSHGNYKTSFNSTKTLFFIGFIGLVVCAVLAQSRAALGATLVASFIALLLWSYVFLSNRYRVYIVVSVAIVVLSVAIIVLISIINPELRELLMPGRFANLFHENAWQGRTSPLIASSLAFMESPFIGWGLGSSYNLNFAFMPPDTELYLGNRSYNHVHNEFLEMAEEGGILMLFTWLSLMCYIMWSLFKVAKNRANLNIDRVISIGCITGILAFYGHGVFSVAQRMVVANLPLYTLLAISFVQIYKHKQSEYIFKIPSFLNKLPNIFLRLLPSSLLIVLGWALFIPIAISFYNMVKISPNLDSLEGLERMEEHMKNWPNPYGLDNLMSYQSRLGRYDKVLESAKAVSEIIPEYRSLGHKESFAYAKLNKKEKAKQRAIEFQKRVAYHNRNLILLGTIALETQDKALFIDQVNKLFQLNIISANPYDEYKSKDMVRFIIDKNTDKRVELKVDENKPGSLYLVFSSSFLKQTMKQFEENNKLGPDYFNQLIKEISSSKILKLPEVDNNARLLELINFEKAYKRNEKDTVDKKTKSYLRSIRSNISSDKEIKEARKQVELIEHKVKKKLAKEKKEGLEELEDFFGGKVQTYNYLAITIGLDSFISQYAAMGNY